MKRFSVERTLVASFSSRVSCAHNFYSHKKLVLIIFKYCYFKYKNQSFVTIINIIFGKDARLRARAHVYEVYIYIYILVLINK